MAKKPAVNAYEPRDPDELLARAEQEFPGISDLLQLYRTYDQPLRQAQEYLKALEPQTFWTTSSGTS